MLAAVGAGHYTVAAVGHAQPETSSPRFRATSNNTEAIELGLNMFMTDRLDDLHQKLGR